MSFRGLLPDPVTVVLASSLLAAHLSMVTAGLLRFSGRPEDWGRGRLGTLLIY